MTGVLLFLISSCSFCAVSDKSCRWAIRPSVSLSGLSALLSLVVGSVAVGLRMPFNSYLDEHGSSLGLSDRDIDTIHTWYIVVVAFFFVSVVIQAFRIWLCQGFVLNAERIDDEYVALAASEVSDWQSHFDAKKTSTSEKYKNLREHYKNKWSKSSSNSNDMI
ncbi:hypothetical protein EON64_02255 [archaeon]|nr:MAG: hypothetical protein EON64_02255 [archaeon]